MIEEGRVTERGTHEELVRLGGTYARMSGIQDEAAREESLNQTAETTAAENGTSGEKPKTYVLPGSTYH